MFIINLTYKTKLEIIDFYIKEHTAFLDEQYKLGNFIISGRKTPRTGGIILCQVHNELELEKIIQKDPFKVNDLADYELIEFVPTKVFDEIKFSKLIFKINKQK
ncbi:YciI family protein [Aquimarina muelleri]|uniref:YCII-related domain-containing protein n=1 Tax=Aquimarina muelleri TaxID=279356 RepID=A0A918JST0_9FLAO|nr:YciI family protein [Aquimarina muelleri]MCX2761164.1 YciI family protein [Aquimarina muelleri]GGX08767.1 hypothetical protein GCM10007384_08160 [Aquimarina muelleri]